MPEGMNVEVAHDLTERDEHETPSARPKWVGLLEVLEVFLLAVVAVATAWSGYQATLWDGQQSQHYGNSSHLRFEASTASVYGGQVLGADANFFTAWLQANAAGDTQLQDLYVKRFSDDYRVAFDAWLATDPFHSPDAPAGPGVMPEYHNPYFAKADDLNNQASAEFAKGTESRETGDKYVRDTVLFASILFMVALSQRLKVHAARAALNVVTFSLLAFAMVSVLILPSL